MGNIAVIISSLAVAGNKRFHSGTLTLSNSYAIGGDSFTLANFGMSAIDHLNLEGSGALLFEPDLVNSKIIARYPTGGATASPAALADPKVTTGAASATAVNATTPDITPGRGKEALAATDLSAITVRWSAIGA